MEEIPFLLTNDGPLQSLFHHHGFVFGKWGHYVQFFAEFLRGWADELARR